jgi:hypothetical protein
MGIATYGSMVFSSMKQILNDVHDADVFVVTLYILKSNNPFLFWVPDGYDPDHFMPWEHSFTSVIAGTKGSGVYIPQSVAVAAAHTPLSATFMLFSSNTTLRAWP